MKRKISIVLVSTMLGSLCTAPAIAIEKAVVEQFCSETTSCVNHLLMYESSFLPVAKALREMEFAKEETINNFFLKFLFEYSLWKRYTRSNVGMSEQFIEVVNRLIQRLDTKQKENFGRACLRLSSELSGARALDTQRKERAFLSFEEEMKIDGGKDRKLIGGLGAFLHPKDNKMVFVIQTVILKKDKYLGDLAIPIQALLNIHERNELKISDIFLMIYKFLTSQRTQQLVLSEPQDAVIAFLFSVMFQMLNDSERSCLSDKQIRKPEDALALLGELRAKVAENNIAEKHFVYVMTQASGKTYTAVPQTYHLGLPTAYEPHTTQLVPQTTHYGLQTQDAMPEVFVYVDLQEHGIFRFRVPLANDFMRTKEFVVDALHQRNILTKGDFKFIFDERNVSPEVLPYLKTSQEHPLRTSLYFCQYTFGNTRFVVSMPDSATVGEFVSTLRERHNQSLAENSYIDSSCLYLDETSYVDSGSCLLKDKLRGKLVTVQPKQSVQPEQSERTYTHKFNIHYHQLEEPLFTVEVTNKIEDLTVGNLKDEIIKIQSLSDRQVLRDSVVFLYGGRILRDSLVLKNLQLNSDDVIVLYIKDLLLETEYV